MVYKDLQAKGLVTDKNLGQAVRFGVIPALQGSPSKGNTLARDPGDRGPLSPARRLLQHRLLSPPRRWRDGPVPVGLGAGRAGAASASVEPRSPKGGR